MQNWKERMLAAASSVKGAAEAAVSAAKEAAEAAVSAAKEATEEKVAQYRTNNNSSNSGNDHDDNSSVGAGSEAESDSVSSEMNEQQERNTLFIPTSTQLNQLVTENGVWEDENEDEDEDKNRKFVRRRQKTQENAQNLQAALDGIEIEEDVAMPVPPAEPIAENIVSVIINRQLSDALSEALNRVTNIISKAVTLVVEKSANLSFAVDMTSNFAEWATTINALCERRHLNVLDEYQQEFTKLSTLAFQFGRLVKQARFQSRFVNISFEVLPTATSEERTTLHDQYIADLGIFIQAVDRLSAVAMVLCATSLAIKKEINLNQEMRKHLGERALITLSSMDVANIELKETTYQQEEDISEELAKSLNEVSLLEEAILGKANKVIALEDQLTQAKDTVEQKLINTELENLKKVLKPLQQELATAVATAKEIRNADRVRQTQIKAKKQEKMQAEKEMRVQQVSASQHQEEFAWESYQAGCKFLTDYARQATSLENLALTSFVQCDLPAVRHTMMTAWLGDLNGHLNQEDRQWLLGLFVPETRDLAVRLSLASGELEIILEDSKHAMLEVLSIPINAVNSPACEILTVAAMISLLERVVKKYSALVEVSNNSLLTIKLPSDISMRAINFIQRVIKDTTTWLNHPYVHPTLEKKSQKAFELIGLCISLYQQDAPEHNFTSQRSSNFPGGGSRLLRMLMEELLELGFDIRASKVIYDAMGKRTPAVEKTATTRSSLLGMRAGENVQGSSAQLSADLEYLFEPCRTEAELSGDRAKIILSKEDGQAHQILVDQLTRRYESELKKLAMAQGDLSEVDRKRIKRIVELMEQLPYAKRLPLMSSDVVQLFILRAQVASYERSSAGEKSSALGSALGKGTRAIFKATGVDRKKGKYEFFVAAFVYFKTKLEQAHSELNEASDKREFSKNFFETKIEGTELNSDREDIGTWLNKTILEGKDTPKALMWLSNSVLNELFDGSDIRAKTIREMQGTSEEAFNAIGASNNSVDEAVYNTSIESANEFFIVLACQAAVLDFSKLMLETDNSAIIEIASQRSWFLQLRFLQAILIEKKVLPVYDAQASAPMYKRERDMLNVFDNMMSHIKKLPDWIDTCFENARMDTRQVVSGMSDIEKTKLAFVLIAEFFSVMFMTLAAASLSKKEHAAATCLASLAEHVNGIKRMAGFTLNGDYESVLFSLAVNFLVENPTLLQRSLISNTFVNGTKGTIKNNETSSLDAHLYSSATNVGIEDLVEEKRLEILSNNKVKFFVTSPLSLPPIGAQENILLADAISRLG